MKKIIALISILLLPAITQAMSWDVYTDWSGKIVHINPAGRETLPGFMKGKEKNYQKTTIKITDHSVEELVFLKHGKSGHLSSDKKKVVYK